MIKNHSWVCLMASIILLSLFSCEEKKDADIEGIELSVDFKRLDKPMFEAAKALKVNPQIEPVDFFTQYFSEDKEFFIGYLGLDDPRLKRVGVKEEQFDSLIGSQLKEFLADSVMVQLLDTLTQIIPYEYPLAERITPPLKRLKLHFPDSYIPKIRTHANGYIPGADLKGADQLSSVPGYISFGLHYFLGRDLPYYPENIYAYQRRRFDLNHFETVFAKSIAEEFVAPRDQAKSRTLLDGMVHAGIKQYFIQELLPYTPDSIRLYYSTEQMQWLSHFEEKNYSYLLDKLFSSDFSHYRNFLADKPFTSELSNESAPRIGEYLGWKIVNAYMERNPDVSLAELCENQDYEGIFRAAKYKP